MEKNPNAVALGKLARGKTSAKKKASSRSNALKGGRPRTKEWITRTERERIKAMFQGYTDFIFSGNGTLLARITPESNREVILGRDALKAVVTKLRGDRILFKIIGETRNNGGEQ